MSFERLLPALTLVLAATWATGQEQSTAPRTVDTARGPMLALPRLDSTSPASVVVEDVRIEMSVEAGFRVYRAHQDGQTRTVYEAADGPAGRYAYDPVERRFDRVSSSLRVRLTDYERLDDVVASAGALRGKNYKALGWALLRLRPEQDPATVARSLLENPLVVGAEVMLEEPIRVPQ